MHSQQTGSSRAASGALSICTQYARPGTRMSIEWDGRDPLELGLGAADCDMLWVDGATLLARHRKRV